MPKIIPNLYQSLFSGFKILEFNKPKNKDDRYSDIDTFINDVQDKLSEEYPDDSKDIKNYIDELKYCLKRWKNAWSIYFPSRSIPGL